MKLLIVGDCKSNSGPAVVNKSILSLDRSILFTKQSGKFNRIIEMVLKIIKSDIIIFSGFSKQNLIGFKICEILNKKYAYLMHGYLKVESKKVCEKRILLEEEMLKRAKIVICVSKSFKNYMKAEYPNYEGKFYYIFNPIMINDMYNIKTIKRDKNTIISVGGGVQTKKILNICKAIDLLNNEYRKEYKLIVIGKNDLDSEKIKQYKFVEYIESVEHKEMKKYYSRASLYIQNSIFETFGLAPIEALLCGCNLIISKDTGCKDIFKSIDKKFIILNQDDIKEIAKKIIFVSQRNNNQELREKVIINNNYIQNLKKILS